MWCIPPPNSSASFKVSAIFSPWKLRTFSQWEFPRSIQSRDLIFYCLCFQQYLQCDNLHCDNTCCMTIPALWQPAVWQYLHCDNLLYDNTCIVTTCCVTIPAVWQPATWQWWTSVDNSCGLMPSRTRGYIDIWTHFYLKSEYLPRQMHLREDLNTTTESLPTS